MYAMLYLDKGIPILVYGSHNFTEENTLVFDPELSRLSRSPEPDALNQNPGYRG